ncbi:MAG: putative FmdB family regulatory protein [Phycisphaerales bacterium]|jgi:putative FmdB family regulatory protein
MPTYDYQCQNCNHEFELFQQMSDPVKKKCPECATLKLKRLIGAGSGIMFKGSGFYETDYRSDAYKKDAKKAQDSATGKKKTDAKSKKEANPSSPTPKKD